VFSPGGHARGPMVVFPLRPRPGVAAGATPVFSPNRASSFGGRNVEADQFVPADKRLRWAAVLAALLLVAGGAAGLGMLHRSLAGIEKLQGKDLQAAIDRAVRLTTIVAWVGGLSFVGCGLWLFRLGHRINRFGRYPPPGTKVIRNTPIRTDAAARRIANLALLGSVVFTTVGTLGMWHLYRLAVDVLRKIAS
jgi:hypothetical protein